jgi:hypothetical protein
MEGGGGRMVHWRLAAHLALEECRNHKMTHHAQSGNRTNHLTHKAERDLFATDPHVLEANRRYDTRSQLPPGWEPAAQSLDQEAIWQHHRKLEAFRTNTDMQASEFLKH